MLSVDGLVKHFAVRADAYGGRSEQVVHAVDSVSFTVDSGEALALVGESGCGKSTVARLVLRLLDPTAGAITFAGTDVTTGTGKALRELRRRAQVVFQDPFASFDPRRRVGDSVAEPLVAQGRRGEVAQRVPELLELVGLDPAVAQRYPHEFSGGQRQRLAIARALSVQPDLLVLDEPVSALDVSIQAQVLALLADLRAQFGLAYLFISHDLAVVRHVADRVAVMHLGHIVEAGPTDDLFADPAHPYTQALLSAVPDPDPRRAQARERIVLVGDPPSPIDPPSGCRFRTRCPLAQATCAISEPLLRARGGAGGSDHLVACPVVAARSAG
ncbi:MAG: ABC transporter ATP-binding protein [Actinomycetota bacterium]